MLNDNIIKKIHKSVAALFYSLLVLVIAGTGCSARTTIELPNNIPAMILTDYGIEITNNTQWIWTNVRFTLNVPTLKETFAYSVKEIDTQQTIDLPAKDFIYNGKSLDPALVGHGSTLNMQCDLPGNREGVSVFSWW